MACCSWASGGSHWGGTRLSRRGLDDPRLGTGLGIARDLHELVPARGSWRSRQSELFKLRIPDTLMRLPQVLIVLILACQPSQPAQLADPPAGFPHAYAHHSCAPWDGAAVAILLTPGPLEPGGDLDRTIPHVEINIWKGVDRLAGTVWTWPTTEQIGAVTRCSADTECEQAATAIVQFRSVDTTGLVEGDVEAAFPSGVMTKGGFRATWWHERMLCG